MFKAGVVMCVYSLVTFISSIEIPQKTPKERKVGYTIIQCKNAGVIMSVLCRKLSHSDNLCGTSLMNLDVLARMLNRIIVTTLDIIVNPEF